ncbi:phosphatase PAP2 family protein [Patescibacteria group bacterium]|nr:phosphatase PAP2 family protein [Patescibacteria group bacterium]MBU4367429.1 phosphatase PAP2 family protein [Patescibacteria group bacterium]MBU4461749.1 phosphatase PAP2 family protein [Patescibacteria group bacterium]MCG2700133.1 phosphatase PAP2 family protein [Candidatus Parcubacteria bacterium]
MILDIIKNLDYQLFQLINQLAFKWEWLDILGVFFAKYFVYLMIAALFLFLLKSRKNWKIIFIALSSALTARFVITGLIRLFKPRLRPFIDSNINLLIDKVNQQSFPSGHASFTFGLAMVVYLYNKKVGVLFFAGAFLVSTSRIFVGVHWPLDILAGAVVGIFSGWLISKLLKFKK